MQENLNIGTRIDGSQDAADNGVIEKYCYLDDPDTWMISMVPLSRAYL